MGADITVWSTELQENKRTVRKNSRPVCQTIRGAAMHGYLYLIERELDEVLSVIGYLLLSLKTYP
jgi:hypothetical protein